MKKILFLLLTLVSAMSVNAQVIKIMKDNQPVRTYQAYEVDNVVFEDDPTVGKATRTGGVEVIWIQLWENGPKFAEYNVGSTSIKDMYAGYYSWGGTTDKDTQGTGVTGVDVLNGDNDTATNLWGSNWRMPTKEEFEALLANCSAEYVLDQLNYNVIVPGVKFTGKTYPYTENSVFFPFYGYFSKHNTDGNLSPQKHMQEANYWSSTNGQSGAYQLESSLYEEDGKYKLGCQLKTSERYYGFSVRAVLK